MKIRNKILDTLNTLTVNDKKLIRGMNPNLIILPEFDNDLDESEDPILFI